MGEEVGEGLKRWVPADPSAEMSEGDEESRQSRSRSRSSSKSNKYGHKDRGRNSKARSKHREKRKEKHKDKHKEKHKEKHKRKRKSKVKTKEKDKSKKHKSRHKKKRHKGGSRERAWAWSSPSEGGSSSDNGERKITSINSQSDSDCSSGSKDIHDLTRDEKEAEEISLQPWTPAGPTLEERVNEQAN